MNQDVKDPALSDWTERAVALASASLPFCSFVRRVSLREGYVGNLKKNDLQINK